MLGALILFIAMVCAKTVSAELLRVHIVNSGIWGAPVGLPSYGDMTGLTLVSHHETGAFIYIGMCLFWALVGVILAIHDLKRRS